MMNQKYLSANTSINGNRLPKLHSMLLHDGRLEPFFLSCNRLYDIGCGKDETRLMLEEEYYNNNGIKYVGYDLTHNPIKWNDRYNPTYKPDIVTISNVLNVIAEDSIVINIVKEAVALAKDWVIISVYEGDKSGIGKVTQNGQSYQRNAKLAFYRELLQDNGYTCFTKYGLLFIEGNARYCYI